MNSTWEPPAARSDDATPLDPVGARPERSERDGARDRAGVLARSRLRGPKGLELRLDSREVVVGDETTELTPQEFEVLRILLERADTVVTADDLSQRAWGHSLDGNRSFMDSLMSRLRSDLGRLGLTNVIHTVRGVGYRIPMPQQHSDSTLTSAPLVDSLTASVLVVDLQDRIGFANKAATALTGYSVAELLALPTSLLLVPGEEVATRQQIAQEARTGAPGRWVRSTIRHKDGATISVMANVSPALDERGALLGTIHEFHADTAKQDEDVRLGDGAGTDADSAA